MAYGATGKEPLIPPHGGYRRLKSFQIAQLLYDVTVRFCQRYIDRGSRTRDQKRLSVPGRSTWAGKGPAAKVVGKLHVTNRNICFDAGLALQENAATELSNRTQAFETLDQRLSIPIKDIREAAITRKFLILKSLQLVLQASSTTFTSAPPPHRTRSNAG
ncbi:MAG: hypothetical protein LLG03_10080 [Planctomycetaceae bacterium]|nr:hypothetical protein [Planctomycetaceae bacterium]